MFCANIFLAISFIAVSATSLFSENNLSTNIDNKLHGQKIRWISPSEAKTNMSQLIPAGIDTGLKINYVARGRLPQHNNTLVPGKAHRTGVQFLMYYAYKNEEFMTSNFELLVVPMDATTWIWVKYDEKPLRRNAIVGGLDPETAKTLYICRGTHEGLVFTGSLLKDSGTCSIPYHSEVRMTKFEVLVLNPYGESLGLQSTELLHLHQQETLQWISGTNAKISYLTPAGRENNLTSYVCRVAYNGGIIPGKCLTDNNSTMVAYIPYQDVAQGPYNDFELLVAPIGTTSWVEIHEDEVQNRAVVGGYNPTGGRRTKTYICRAWQNDNLVVGKVLNKINVCLIPYHGFELKKLAYELLVVNAYGISIGISPEVL